jgi:hypothetical protein
MLREILQELARRNSLETSLSTALVPAPQEHLLLPQTPVSESLPVDAHLGLPKAALAPDPSASEPAPERECTTQGELSVYVPFNIIA